MHLFCLFLIAFLRSSDEVHPHEARQSGTFSQTVLLILNENK